MVRDNDASVRAEAAQRLDAGALYDLASDVDWRVRYEVARRAPINVVARLAQDVDPIVSETAQERIKGSNAATTGKVTDFISREH